MSIKYKTWLSHCFILFTFGIQASDSPLSLNNIIHHEGAEFVAYQKAGTEKGPILIEGMSVLNGEKVTIEIPSDIESTIIVDKQHVYFKRESSVMRIPFATGKREEVLAAGKGFLFDVFVWMDKVITIAGGQPGRKVSIYKNGELVQSHDLPSDGFYRASTLQGGKLIISFSGEFNLGTSFFVLDTVTGFLVERPDELYHYPEFGLTIRAKNMVIKCDSKLFSLPYDLSGLLYFRHYKDKFLFVTAQRAICIDGLQSTIVEPSNVIWKERKADIILTDHGLCAISADGKIILDWLTGKEQKAIN